MQAYHNKDGSTQQTKNTHLDATQAFIQQNKAPSVWVPQRSDTDPEIYDFAQTINEELKRITHKSRRNRQNLNKNQQKALKRLAKRKDFILKSADKGAGVILLSPTQYEEEAYSQLNDQKTYKIVDQTAILKLNIKY